MSAPRATVRLQFHEGFPITDAIDLVEYFHKLGISDIYASPLTRARAGSTHGYDTIDYHVISPELGGEEALRKLVARLREFGMGLILDIVPNHMGVSPDNAWWWSVLREGPNSRYAEYFDIDWNSPDPSLKGKLLAPYLGDPYGKVLSEGQLKIERDQKTHEPIVTYYDARFPIAPEHHDEVLRLMDETPQAFDAARTDGRQRLHELLERQHYRLAWWRTAAEEINWRRFFEISDLAGMRAERDAVRDDIHSLFFRLYEEGLVDGLRVDHVDGLADPKAYCQYLRAELEKRADRRPADAPKRVPYVVVEKILAAGEPLATSWQTDGTTGYDFMSEVGQWLHDPQGEATLTTMWQSISGSAKTFTELSRTARRQLIQQNFAGEFDALVRLLHRIAHFDLMTRDWSPSAIRRVLTELLVSFPVYRTYADVRGRTEQDEVPFSKAREGAHASLRPADYDLLDTMAGWLGGEPPKDYPEDQRAVRLQAIRRFQQLTSPLAAKSVEDTGFYRYGRLLSRNEVGADPAIFSMESDEFHQRVQGRAESFPLAMLATATHDHKRGEDGRARLAVLSERAAEWEALVTRWSERHAAFKREAGEEPAPSPLPADEYMLYQSLIGAWPLDLSINDEEGIRELAGRLSDWQTKSLREAKQQSSWVTPDDSYEKACNGFLFQILDPQANADTLLELVEFINRIGPAGAVNSLSQTLLRMTIPGVPDLYQGTEMWDFSLVDPDNRRPVDFALRKKALDEPFDAAALVDHWRDGRIKFEVVRRTLNFRKQHEALFLEGDYLPLTVEGTESQHVFAYARKHADSVAIVIVPHRVATMVLGTNDDPKPRIAADKWGDTVVCLPEAISAAISSPQLRSVLTDATCAVADGRIRVADALADLPVALLT